MNTALLLTYALTVTLLIASPGPVVALVVNTAASAGRRQALLTALGSNAAALVLIALASSLLLSSAVIDPRWLSALSLLGCLYIGYLAISSLRQALASDTEACQARAQQGGLQQGFAIGLSNPKDILFFVALFPQFIQITADTGHSLLLLALVWMVVDMAILALYIVLTARLATPRSRQLIRLCSAVVLLLIASTGLLYTINALWH